MGLLFSTQKGDKAGNSPFPYPLKDHICDYVEGDTDRFPNCGPFHDYIVYVIWKVLKVTIRIPQFLILWIILIERRYATT